MSAVLLPNGEQQFVDENGLPLVGGTVTFYVPGTTIPKTTWQDALETTPNTNPVVLDSAGRAIIYGSGQYRQIVRDVNGNTVWDALTASASLGTFGPEEPITAASTTDLGSLSSNNALINGTTTISSFGTSADLNNPFFITRFNGVLTLTNNDTSLALPGSTDITTAANDMAMWEFMNVLGYWRCVFYFPADGISVVGAPPIGPAGGDLTGSYPNPLINLNKVTNAKLAKMAAYTIKANITNALADPQDATAAQIATLINAITTVTPGFPQQWIFFSLTGGSYLLIQSFPAGAAGPTATRTGTGTVDVTLGSTALNIGYWLGSGGKNPSTTDAVGITGPNVTMTASASYTFQTTNVSNRTVYDTDRCLLMFF